MNDNNDEDINKEEEEGNSKYSSKLMIK